MHRTLPWLALATIACTGTDPAKVDTDPPPPPPPQCPAGQVERSGACMPIGSDVVCPAGARPKLGADACVPLGKAACAAGFTTAPDGVGCRPTLPDALCPDGRRAKLGETTCVEVGWTDCAPLFDTSPSGYGCVDRTPGRTCEGSTRIDLMTGTCAAVDTCDGMFAGDVVLGENDDVQAAIDAATAGDTIVLLAGTYNAAIRVDKAIVLRGVCSSDTIVAAGIAISGNHASTLSNLTILGGTLSVFDGATVEASAIVVDGATDTGALVREGGALTLTNSVVRGTAGAGTGIFVDLRGRLNLEDVEIAGGRAAGVRLARGAVVDARRVTVHHVRPRAGDDGDAFGLREGGTLTLSESAIFEIGGMGLGATTANASITLDRVVFRRGYAGVQYGGVAMTITSGAQVTGSRVQMERNTEAGIFTQGTGVLVDLEKAVIVGTRAPIGGIASGVVAVQGPTIRLNDSVVLDNSYAGVAVLQGTAEITGSRVGRATDDEAVGVFAGRGGTTTVVDSELLGSKVYEAQPRDRGSVTRLERTVVWGSTLGAFDGGRLEVVDSAIVNAIDYAIGVDGPGTTLLVSGTTINGTRTGENITVGEALIMFEGATGVVEDSDFYDNQKNAVYVTASATLEIARTIVSETVVDGVGGKQANGIENYGNLTLRDTAIVDNQNWGVYGTRGSTTTIEGSLIANNGIVGVFGAKGSKLFVRDTTIEDTRAAPAGGPDPGEYGFGVLSGARTLIEGSIVRNNVSAGLGLGLNASTRGNRADVVNTVVLGTAPDAKGFGHGLFAAHLDEVFVRESFFVDNASIGFAFHDATGLLTGSASIDNAIGIHAQARSTVREVSSEPDGLSPQELLVTSDCVFVGNETKIGAGEVPLPGLPD